MSSSPPSWIVRLAAGALVSALACGAEAASLAFDQPGLQAPASLRVALGGVADGGVLPTNYTADGRNLSPPLSWSAGPSGTAGYAVVMEDADALQAPVRWLAYGLPAGLTTLPKGVHNLAAPTHPLGLLQGRNDHAGFGYAGPRPQPGEPPHHYHLEVFALDRAPRLAGGASLAELERAMSGHVLARGELVVTYPAPPRPPKPDAATETSASSPAPQG
jgi:Raf kinase inhibitor-like YbhB/YbcL family protein